MTKLVKVQVNGMPIVLSNSVKAFGYHGPVMMTVKDIFTCLAGGAIVKEICGDKEILLNFSNYDKENVPKVHVDMQSATPDMDGGVVILPHDGTKPETTLLSKTEEIRAIWHDGPTPEPIHPVWTEETPEAIPTVLVNSEMDMKDIVEDVTIEGVVDPAIVTEDDDTNVEGMVDPAIITSGFIAAEDIVDASAATSTSQLYSGNGNNNYHNGKHHNGKNKGRR